ncbi:MAG: hypothetical protein KKE23_03285 [Nanoarchaeota archaeon]|nr:hypothetical protein [Nanoarchaeota archaeon]
MAMIEVKEKKLVDFSFIPSLKCNLSCKHCMYNSSPYNPGVLNLEKTKKFVSTIDYSKINAMGFYGGEISYDYEAYQRIIDLVQKKAIKFTITNGTWSVDERETQKFIDFINKNELKVFISDTKFHRPFQNESLLKRIAVEQGFSIKEEDDIIPMGRASKNDWGCSEKCGKYFLPMRLTLNTKGEIMFLNCDGRYPVIGNYNENFDHILSKGLKAREYCEKRK